jgi:hypothetical protein
MLFTSIKKNNNQYEHPIKQQPITLAPLMTRRNAFLIKPNIQPSTVPIVTNSQIMEKKMKWGAPIWYFFHTVAEKVKEEHFLEIKTELINNIVLVCKNLPCPNCAMHATDYMSKINLNAIRTKDEFKTLLFNFHNTVNKKKGYPIFTREELDEKYKKAITINIFNNFLLIFQDKHKSIRMIADDMYRQRIALYLKDWLSMNYNKFES